jgi:hypothetical protein
VLKGNKRMREWEFSSLYPACTRAKCALDIRPSIFIRDKPTFSSERMLHKDYYHKGSVEKKSLVVSIKGLDGKTK